MNLRLAPGQHIRRRDEADGTVQALGRLLNLVCSKSFLQMFPDY